MSQPIPRLTPDEFLAWECEQTTKHVYVGGEVFAMAGGSPRHNNLSMRVVGQLSRKIDKKCEMYSSDQKIGLDDQFVYADVVVICGSPVVRPGTSDVITNPTVVIEVLSKSTEAYDRGDKQKGYLATPSVQHFVLVSQREPRVELYTRQTDGTFRFEVMESGSGQLERIGASLEIDELYEGAFELPGD